MPSFNIQKHQFPKSIREASGVEVLIPPQIFISKHTHITDDVRVSTGGEDRDGVTLDLKLLGFDFLPIILVTVLQEEKAMTSGS